MIANLISSLYDILVQTMSLSSMPGTYFQFAWPAIGLSAADFKLTATGPDDANAAEETFSLLCNMASTVNPLRFENSGFEIDDLYQMLILGAIPLGADPNNLLVNPIYKLFADAQFEFAQGQKGSNRDPSVFYYPCRATPSDWYSETASQHWPTLSITTAQVQPARPDSAFIRLGGQRLIDEGVLKLRPRGGSSAVLKGQIQSTIKNVLAKFDPRRTQLTGARPLEALRSRALKPAITRAVGRLPLSGPRPVAILEDGVVAARFVDMAAALAAKKDLRLTPALAALPSLDRVNIDAEKYVVVPSAELTVDRRVLLQRVLDSQLLSAALTPQTTNFQISCRFCLVNITRPWFKSALLNLRSWYMFGAQAGDYASGTLDHNPGMFPMLPSAFLAIRDLKISAQWSAQDRQNLPRAKYLGPFDIGSATLQADSLSSSGLQIVGWLSRLNPMLPPLSQPTG